MLDTLERLGLAQDTIVVFGTDHGELLGDHGLWLKGPFLYEGLIRVPWLWRWPGVFPEGRVVPAVTSYLDFAQTVLELAGVAADPAMQGASMAPLLRDDPGEHYNRWQDPKYAPTREALMRSLVGAMVGSARPVLPRLSYA